MARMGRPPKPTALKILTGNPGRRPLPTAEVRPDPSMPTCPDWLDDAAKEKWAELAPQLHGLGMLTSIDGDALAAYCQAWAEFKQATQTLQREGRYIDVGSQKQSHPAVAQQRSAWQALQRLGSLFGLSPSGRVGLPAGRAGQADALETFLEDRG